MTDEKGVLVPDDDRTVRFSVEGAVLLGVCNGDPTGHHPQTAATLPLFHGRGQVMLSGEPGVLTVEADGLPSVTVTL